MLSFICRQCKGKAAGGYAKLAVDLEPHLRGGSIHRCFQSADGGQRKIRNIGIQDNVPVIIACPVCTLPDPGDADSFFCRLRSFRFGSLRLGGLRLCSLRFCSFRGQCTVCMGVEYKSLLQGVFAQNCAGGNSYLMLSFICRQCKGKAAGGYAKLAVDLEPHLRGGSIHRCFQSADGGQRKIRNIGIQDNVPVIIACPVCALPDPGDADGLGFRLRSFRFGCLRLSNFSGQCAVCVGMEHKMLR